MWVKNTETGSVFDVDEKFGEYLLTQKHFEETAEPAAKKKPTKE